MTYFAQSVTSRYALRDARRKPGNHDPQCCETQFDFNLPLYLTREYAERHQLSVHDICHGLYGKDQVALQHLWALALYHNIDIIPGATVSTAAGDVQFRSFPHVAAKLQALVPACQHTENRLVCPHDTHRPAVPVHFVSEQQIEQLSACLGSLVRWRGILAVPTRAYHGYVHMVRVVPKSVMVQQLDASAAVALTDIPFEHLVQGQVFCETEERFLLQTRDAHMALVELAKQWSPEAFLEKYERAVYRPECKRVKRE